MYLVESRKNPNTEQINAALTLPPKRRTESSLVNETEKVPGQTRNQWEERVMKGTLSTFWRLIFGPQQRRLPTCFER